MDPINQSNELENRIILGQFGRVHGVNGMVRVHAFTEDPKKILTYKNWYRYDHGTWVETEIVQEAVHHQTILVKIKGFETREAAMELNNLKISVPRHHLPQLSQDEFYCFELVGMEVYNCQEVLLGKVIEIMQTGANDVLIIEGKKRLLIPFLRDQVIIMINRDQRKIIADWDEAF